MKKFCFLYFLCLGFQIGFGQPNCLLLKDSICVSACQLSIEASNNQGSRHSQELFDQAIAMCPNFAYAYYEKSVPYLKHGLINEWKVIIDKAVELEPQSYLINRGCNQIQFFRNYKKGIEDLEKLGELYGNFNIGYTNSGEYHAQMIRAIAYRKLGQVDQSIAIMEQMVSSPWYSQGLYDFLHIGVSYLEAGELEKAKIAFDRQNEAHELAETYFYYSKIYEQKNRTKQALEMLNKSKELYQERQMMFNRYYHYFDKVFYTEIEDNLIRLGK